MSDGTGVRDLASQRRRRRWLWAATLIALAALVWALGLTVARRPARPELGVTQGLSEPVEAHQTPPQRGRTPKGKVSAAPPTGAPSTAATAEGSSTEARPSN